MLLLACMVYMGPETVCFLVVHCDQTMIDSFYFDKSHQAPDAMPYQFMMVAGYTIFAANDTAFEAAALQSGL